MIRSKDYSFDVYRPVQAVCTGLPADQYTGGTADWDCFCPITTRNRPITVDFDADRFQAVSAEGGRKKKREKKNLESVDPSPRRLRDPSLCPSARTAIPMDPTRTDRYILVRPLIGTQIARYRAVPLIGVVSAPLPSEIGQ
ncbi:hypothetical protein BHM03_00043985 [Ensete ventricosum]|nr:hypothetical protein BHM03_00043985 [Ensete ventricosum]